MTLKILWNFESISPPPRRQPRQVGSCTRSKTRGKMIKKVKPKKPSPPTIGLAVVADLWLWGALFLFIPNYFGIFSGWQYLFIIPGFIFLIISFAGALTELGKLWKSEGLGYWGASLVFLIPSIALYFAVKFQRITGDMVLVAKIGAILLLTIGGPFFFHGIPYFFWKKDTEVQETESTTSTHMNVNKEVRKSNLKAIANIIVALLALATAAINLVDKIMP